MKRKLTVSEIMMIQDFLGEIMDELEKIRRKKVSKIVKGINLRIAEDCEECKKSG